MDDFEARLKSVPLAKPSADIKRRIFGTEPSRSRLIGIFRRRIPLGWAAAFALATGIAGMSGSQMWGGRAAAPLQPVVHVQIIKALTDRNIFDFTEPAADFMPGDLTVRIETPKEI